MKLTKLAMASVFAASVVSFSSMADNTGSVEFVGTVVNSPCNIENNALKPVADFGQLSNKSLEAGNVAETKFRLEFTGCDFDNWDVTEAGDPVAVSTMNLTFTGTRYVGENNSMLATSLDNNNNLGVRIDGFQFGTAQDVLPRIVNKVGDNTLEFTALAQRVNADQPVSLGKFSAISNFRITYQ